MYFIEICKYSFSKIGDIYAGSKMGFEGGEVIYQNCVCVCVYVLFSSSSLYCFVFLLFLSTLREIFACFMISRSYFPLAEQYLDKEKGGKEVILLSVSF